MLLIAMERELRSNLTNAFSFAHQASSPDACTDADQHSLQEAFITPALRHSCTALSSLN